MKKLVYKIATKFNARNIFWGVGGSQLLSYFDITREVNDLDIIVSKESIEEALIILSKLGSVSDIPIKEEYLTESFTCFNIDDMQLDVISGFKIKHECGVFEFKFEKNKLTYINLNNTIIPLTSLEQWYIAYLLMKKRDEKVNRIEEYFIKTKHVNVEDLKLYQNQQFACKINKRIDKLVKALEKSD